MKYINNIDNTFLRNIDCATQFSTKVLFFQSNPEKHEFA